MAQLFLNLRRSLDRLHDFLAEDFAVTLAQPVDSNFHGPFVSPSRVAIAA